MTTDRLKDTARDAPSMRRLVTVNWDAAIPLAAYVSALPLTLYAFAGERYVFAAALVLLCATFVRAMFRNG